jgi:hypothetical protein
MLQNQERSEVAVGLLLTRIDIRAEFEVAKEFAIEFGASYRSALVETMSCRCDYFCTRRHDSTVRLARVWFDRVALDHCPPLRR